MVLCARGMVDEGENRTTTCNIGPRTELLCECHVLAQAHLGFVEPARVEQKPAQIGLRVHHIFKGASALKLSDCLTQRVNGELGAGNKRRSCRRSLQVALRPTTQIGRG